uniref:F-box domain-containing protein n=1 Tax=Panagrolaimus superbus TaxID=310955 RepID=A0A914XS40_9BILA
MSIEPYRIQFDKLNQQLQETSDVESRKAMIDSFSTNYLLLPNFWKLRLKYESTLDYEREKKYIKKALFDFYSKDFYDSLDPMLKCHLCWDPQPFDRIMEWENIEAFKSDCLALMGKDECTLADKIQQALSYPHSNLKDVYQCYREFSGAPVTKEIREMFQYSFLLYMNIQDSQRSVTKWFNAVLETEDDRFIIQNIECKLAELPNTVILWRLYIQWLRGKNQKAALEVYFRYRRLFLDDTTMDSEIGLHSFRPSHAEHRYLQKMKFRKSHQATKPNFSSQNSLTFYFTSEAQNFQRFDFPTSVINAILKNASPELLQKLYQSSKYFFNKVQKPLCHTLFIGNTYKVRYFQHSLAVDEKYLDFQGLNNLRVANGVVVRNHFRQDLLSLIIPKLDSCVAKFIRIHAQTLSVSDYEFLTKSENVEKIVLSEVIIREKDGTLITLENLLKPLPKATHIEIPIKTQITSETASKIAKMKRKSQFDYLQFFISAPLSPKGFIKFLTENAAKNSCVKIHFDENLSHHYTDFFLPTIEYAVEQYSCKYGTNVPQFKEF